MPCLLLVPLYLDGWHGLYKPVGILPTQTAHPRLTENVETKVFKSSEIPCLQSAHSQKFQSIK